MAQDSLDPKGLLVHLVSPETQVFPEELDYQGLLDPQVTLPYDEFEFSIDMYTNL